MSVTIQDLPDVEYMLPGSAACGGCPSSLALRIVSKALGKNVIMIMTPSCAVASIGPLPKSCYTIPVLNVCFASAGASAAGLTMALDALYEKGRLKGEKPTVFNWAGDGGTYDIGFQGISAAAERNDDFIHFCYNNEAYSNTGMQRSGATPIHAATTTTPLGKDVHRKNLPLLMLEHRIPYVATASLAYPMDLFRKVKKAKDIRGFKYIEIHAPCYTGWKFPSSDTVKMSRLAVQTGSWLLWEAEFGKVTLNNPTSLLAQGKIKPAPLEEYIGKQGRYAHLAKSPNKEEILDSMKAEIRRELKFMAGRAEL
ncbi:MAG: pyruvate ferredoxin oxidoreductase beta subunit [Thermoanaerobacteraceae bacterium]|nr:pyruvate ferredoxin oxidoreductase beta subunit [Thermoanaerobacteraceae bacterium]